MNYDDGKTVKHRSKAQINALCRRIIECIEAESQVKNLGELAGVSKTYAYSIAKRLGYSQMLVSNIERQLLRERRGTTKLFRRAAA